MAVWHLHARGGGAHPLQPSLSDVSAVSAVDPFGTEGDEQLSLLPPPGHHHSRPTHKKSFSNQFDNAVHTFQVAMFKPPRELGAADAPAGDPAAGSSRTSTSASDEPFLTVADLAPSKSTAEWLQVGLALLPKISWGWLPFCFSFLGFSAALKLLLFITLFSVYSAATLYRLYLHSDKQGQTSLADIGEAAFGRRLGRRPIVFLTRTINIATPAVLHVGGTRFLQMWAFYTTPVCLPWISLLFGAIVLALAQSQRLGAHPALARIVQPALTALAVATTVLKLTLLRAQHDAGSSAVLDAVGGGPGAPAESSPLYLSDYVIAIVQLVSANYCGQHVFMESMSGMESPSTFQHSIAWASIITLLTNLAVAVAALRVQHLLHVKGFISFAFGPDLLSRFLSFVCWLVMTAKYLFTLHMSTKALLPRLPHLLVSSDEVDSRPMQLHPRQLWLICSGVIVACSFLVSSTFPHTFMYLSGLLVSLCFIPVAFTAPCLFSLKLLGSSLTSLEYTLSTWIVPVSILMSLLGCWACCYHLVLKWEGPDHGGSWGCNLLVPPH